MQRNAQESATSEMTYSMEGTITFANMLEKYQQAKAWIDNTLQSSASCYIDFSAVSYSNSAGLALLLALQRYTHQQRKKICFIYLPAKLLAAANISQVDTLLCIATPSNN